MVRILYDPEHLISPTGEQIISNISEYAEVYTRLLSAVQNSQDMRFIIHLQAVYQWLKNLATRYPQGTFLFETLDARQALAQRWGVSLPPEVRNQEILASGLLALHLPQAQPGQSFADLLLAHFYSPFLAGKTFPFTQLHQLLQPEVWQVKHTDPLCKRPSKMVE